MPPANSFVRPFSYIGLSEYLLLSSYMWVSLMHTPVWLVPNILSNRGVCRSLANHPTAGSHYFSSSL